MKVIIVTIYNRINLYLNLLKIISESIKSPLKFPDNIKKIGLKLYVVFLPILILQFIQLHSFSSKVFSE